MFQTLKFGGLLDYDTHYKMERLMLAERFGWTLDYIDTLDMQDFAETPALLRALELARRPSGGSG